MEQRTGLLAWVFDFSFRDFVTLKLIKFLYGLSLFFSGVTALIFIIMGFGGSVGYGILSLILSPLIFLFLAFISRIYLEVMIVLFRMEENIAKLAEQGRLRPPPKSIGR